MPALAKVPPDPAANLRPYRDYRGGTRKPYRPAPADFREVYLRMGWDRKIEEHYRAHWQTIRRWIEECGGEELRQARAAITGYRVRPDIRSRLPSYAEALASTSKAAPGD